MPTFGHTSDSVVVNPTVDRYTATASQTVFTLTNTPSSVVLVWVNGILQEPATHYTISGRTLTLGTACTVGDKVAAEYGTDRTGTGRDRRWTRGSSPHAQDDEFNDESLSGSWIRVDKSGGSGRVTWAEAGDSLSGFVDGSDSAAELHAQMRAYALAVGESIQCHLVWNGVSGNYHVAGLVVANGVTFTAGLQEVLSYFPILTDASGAEWSGYDTRTAFADNTVLDRGSLHLRIKRSATNTYQHFVSPDGISWVQVGADRTQTMTPSHVGVFISSWTASTDFVFAFDYFRVI